MGLGRWGTREPKSLRPHFFGQVVEDPPTPNRIKAPSWFHTFWLAFLKKPSIKRSPSKEAGPSRTAQAEIRTPENGSCAAVPWRSFVWLGKSAFSPTAESYGFGLCPGRLWGGLGQLSGDSGGFQGVPGLLGIPPECGHKKPSSSKTL